MELWASQNRLNWKNAMFRGLQNNAKAVLSYSFIFLIRGLPSISRERGLEDFSVKRQFSFVPPHVTFIVPLIASPLKLNIEIRGPQNFKNNFLAPQNLKKIKN